jgi:uncharacterized membrane protein YphA (DoxX/SURF4 family)
VTASAPDSGLPQDARRPGNGGTRDADARLTPAAPGGGIGFLLRLAVGIPELWASVQKLQDLPSLLGAWRIFHLPAAGVLAPAYAAAELLGALLLLVGWKTRIAALFFVADFAGEILVTKRPLLDFSGWTLEWQALCVVIVLARVGGGGWSFDRFFGRRASRTAAGPKEGRDTARDREADLALTGVTGRGGG